MLKAWYAWIVVAVLALCAVAFGLGYKQGKSVCKGEWTLAENAMLNEALTMRQEYEKVLNESKERQKAIFVDFSNATDSLVQLRESAENVSESTIAAANRAASIRGELLAKCAKEYTGMAKYADIHALDAQTCHDSWEAFVAK